MWPASPLPPAASARCCRLGRDRGRRRGRCCARCGSQVASSTSKSGPVLSSWSWLPWSLPCSIRWPTSPVPPARAGRCRRLGRDRDRCLGRWRARSGGVLDPVARWPGGQLHQQERIGAVALVVIVLGVLAGAVLDPVASSTSSISKAGRCCRLIVIAVGALVGAVFDPVASSTRSTSEAGPALLPWSWLPSVPWPLPCSILWPAPPDPPARPGRRCLLGRDRGRCLGRCRARSGGQFHQFHQQGGPVLSPWS